MTCIFKKIVKTRENFRIYVQISGPNSNFRTFQDKFQNFRNFRTMPRAGLLTTYLICNLPAIWIHRWHDMYPRAVNKLCYFLISTIVLLTQVHCQSENQFTPNNLVTMHVGDPFELRLTWQNTLHTTHATDIFPCNHVEMPNYYFILHMAE